MKYYEYLNCCMEDDTTIVNAAVVNESYQLTNAPVIVEI